jgi:hypothetical protein
VGNKHRSLVVDHVEKPRVDLVLRTRVQGRRGLVQDNDRRVLVEGMGNGKLL